MKVVIAIPARYGSTRLPGKALAEIGGEPMVVRVERLCRRVRNADRVLVATDDARILEAVRSAGGQAVLTSPDHPSGTDRIAEAVRGESCDLVVNVQGDEPFLDPTVVESLIAAFAENGPSDAATVASPIRRPTDLYDPSVVKVLIGRNENAVSFSRYPIPWRSDLWRIGPDGWFPADPAPDVSGYLRHVGIYAYRYDFLRLLTTLPPTPGERAERLEQLRILEHGYLIRVIVTPWDSLSVDTPEDLERARSRHLGM